MKPQRQPTRPSDGPPPRKRIKGGTITIPLPSRPKDYIPGSGPPLQPVELLPPSDSTAYIVERILLPPAGLAKDGKPLPKRMAYIVGWRDLPAARLLVPVMEILDYVSPFALEEWEYNMELELEQDRARLEEEKRELQQHPAKAASKAKARPPVHSEIEAAAVAEAESDGQAKGRMKKGVMSLSTPQKTKMEAFADLSDGYDGYESPSEQIARESAKMDVDESSESTSTSEPKAQIESQGVGGAQLSEVRASGSKAATSSEPPTVTVRDLASTAEPRQPHPFFKSTNNNKNARTQGAIVPVRATSAPTNDLVAVRRRDVPIPVPINHKRRPNAPKQRAVKREVTDTPSTGDDDWEVERIEGSELFEVEGEGLTRYFKVRWAGDWPADQNPTWEPEENLPTKLVRGYMKTPQKRQKTNNVEVARTHTPKAVKAWVQSTLSWPPAGTATSVGGAATVEDGDEGSSKESSSRGDSDEEASSEVKPKKEVSGEQNSSDDSSEGESNDDSSSDEDSSQSGGSESAG